MGRPPSAGEIDDLHRRLEELARHGDWSGLASAMKRRDALLASIVPADRATTFQAAVLCNERILELVRSGRQSVCDDFLELRQRQDAVSRYESHREVGKKPR